MAVVEALPGVSGNSEKRVFISGEQGNKGQILKGTGEQGQYWGTGNIRKQIFDFWGTWGTSQFISGEQVPPLPPGGPRCSVVIVVLCLVIVLLCNT